MRQASAIAVAVAAAGPSGAAAHAFDPDADAYSQIMEGALVPVSDPVLLLALLPLGLTLGIWAADGPLRIWPALAAGLVGGALAAPLAGLWIAHAAILMGLAVSLMGAAARRWPLWLMVAVAAATGTVSGMAVLEGHAFGSLPAPIYLGVVFGALLVVLVPAGAVSFTRDSVGAPWVTIAWRIAASWLAAIAMMLAALRFA